MKFVMKSKIAWTEKINYALLSILKKKQFAFFLNTKILNKDNNNVYANAFSPLYFSEMLLYSFKGVKNKQLSISIWDLTYLRSSYLSLMLFMKLFYINDQTLDLCRLSLYASNFLITFFTITVDSHFSRVFRRKMHKKFLLIWFSLLFYPKCINKEYKNCWKHIKLLFHYHFII